MNVRAIFMQNSNVVRLLKLLSLINFLHQPFCVFTSNWAVGKFHGRFGQQKQSNSELQNLRHLNSNQITSKAKFVSFTTEFQILSKKPKYQFKNMKKVKTIEILKNIYYIIFL